LDNNCLQESAVRRENEFGWNEEGIEGKTIVGFGSGAGRFLEPVSKMKPRLAIFMEITDAADASPANLGDIENFFFVQADIFRAPFKWEFSDFIYCVGILRYTYDTHKVFETMAGVVRDNGNVAVSPYDISQYYRLKRKSLKVATSEVLWALNMWSYEFFRKIAICVPHNLMILHCRTVTPILNLLKKILVIGLVRYLLPSSCCKKLSMIYPMVDTMDVYSLEIVHQNWPKDVFQWFPKLELKNIGVMNSRAGWVTLKVRVGAIGHER